MKKFPITVEFDFEKVPADTDLLTAGWLSEIEQVARAELADARYLSFFISAMKLGARSKGVNALKLATIVEKAGYSRSTFFRLYPTYSDFLFDGYKLMCLLSTKVYMKHLRRQKLSLEDFCDFTADVFFSANCTIPHDFIRMLWRDRAVSHEDFHPHIADLATQIRIYLNGNSPTQHLRIDDKEIRALLKSLDLIMLNARIEDDPSWGTPFYYRKLRKMLLGYLLTCVEAPLQVAGERNDNWYSPSVRKRAGG